MTCIPPGVPEQDDVNVSREDIANNLEAFNFRSRNDVAQYETLYVHIVTHFETISVAQYETLNMTSSETLWLKLCMA